MLNSIGQVATYHAGKNTSHPHLCAFQGNPYRGTDLYTEQANRKFVNYSVVRFTKTFHFLEI